MSPFYHIFQDYSIAQVVRGVVITKQAFAICCDAIYQFCRLIGTFTMRKRDNIKRLSGRK